MKTKRMLFLAFVAVSIMTLSGCVSTINYASIFVPEEGGMNFVKITEETSEQLIIPNIKFDKSTGHLSWWTNPYFAISKDGGSIAYISSRNDQSNIFVKGLATRTGSQQRTFQGGIQDVAFSPDGKTICFTKRNFKGYEYVPQLGRVAIYDNLIFTTSATAGSIVRQVSAQNSKDYGAKFSLDGNVIFFSRADGNSYSIWSHDLNTGALTNYCMGLAPVPVNNEELLCMRMNSRKNYEIWLVNYVKGSESMILAQDGLSFSTASMSPDGKWILCVSNTPSSQNAKENLDIYVVRSDGSQLTRLTYHPGNDLSPVWAPDGKAIYFLSQRGSEKGEYNVWKMNFNL